MWSFGAVLLDEDQNSPVHLSVVNGHRVATYILLLFATSGQRKQSELEELGDLLAKVLHLALLSNSTEIVKKLLDTGLVNINYVQPNGETAFFIASRTGSLELVNSIVRYRVKYRVEQAIDPNVPEKSYGWTPLIVACVMGHKELVEVLLDLNANQSHCDAFGWTALDHAAFRGFWSISKLLQPITSNRQLRVPKLPLRSTNALPPCTSGTTRVIVNLAALNTRKPLPAVDLAPYLLRYPVNPYPEVGFSVTVSGLGMDGDGGSLDLPILDDKTNHPFIFETDDPQNAKLLFTIYRQSSTSPSAKICVGTSVGLLEELGSSLGPGRESLFRDHQMPIIGTETGDFIGTLTMNFLLVKPFPDPRARPQSSKSCQRFRKSNEAITLIGHRG